MKPSAAIRRWQHAERAGVADLLHRHGAGVRVYLELFRAFLTLALALAHGSAFTFFSPFLGWLGVFLTGSDTSSNALFASLRATAAQQIGVSDADGGGGIPLEA